MEGRSQRQRRPTAKADPNFQQIRRTFSDEREIETSNEQIMRNTLEITDQLDQQPMIVQNAVNELHRGDNEGESDSDVESNANELQRGSSSAEVVQHIQYKCSVRNCAHDLAFQTLAEFIEHHVRAHPENRLSKKKCDDYKIVQCYKCRTMYNRDSVKCEHLQHATISDPQSLYPCESWSITIVATRSDVPTFLLEDFDEVLNKLGSTCAIASLERGDKENNLHLQGAAQFCWNREDPKSLVAYLRAKLQLSEKCPDLTFKIQAKVFQVGQNWLAMIGYCQKWQGHAEYRMVSRGMSERDLRKGQLFLTVYRSDYTKDKFVLDINNILKAGYAHWVAAIKPQFATFDDVLLAMLQSGEYVVSGKLLSSAPLDKNRTARAWETLLQPYESSSEQVHAILYGSQAKPVQHSESSTARYSIADFNPCTDDSDLIPFLQHNLIKRRHNVVLVGAAGCGKSCLIQTLCMQHGVQYFGTADELKEVAAGVQFVVFDDFDFSQFSTNDVKRILDREFDAQRVRVRFHDAVLTKYMTRIILCNSLPECFDDDAVRDRYVTICLLQSIPLTSSSSLHTQGPHQGNPRTAVPRECTQKVPRHTFGG
jgi:hypothetical protein